MRNQLPHSANAILTLTLLEDEERRPTSTAFGEGILGSCGDPLATRR